MLTKVNHSSKAFDPSVEAFFMPVLFFEMDGCMKYANSAAKTLFIHEPDILALNFNSLFKTDTPDTWQSIKNHLNISGQSIQKQLTVGDELICQAQFYICNNFESPLIQCAITHYDEFVDADTVEIPEIKKNGKQTLSAYSESIYRALANCIPNGVLILFDKKLVYRLAEGQGLELMGFNKKNITGESFADLHDDEYKDKFKTIYLAALEGITTQLEYKSNEGHWLQLSVMPFSDVESKLEGGLIIGFSINGLKKAEHERDKKIEELWYTNNQLKIENGVRKLIERNMYEQKFELEQKNLELEQFAYVASHDLQEPLRMVSSYTQLLGVRYTEKLDTEAKEFISFAVEGATRMQALITDLLSYSRVGRKEMSFEKINLDIILQVVQRNLSLLIEETCAEVQIGALPFVQADASQLVQLFQNLVSNAIKFRSENNKPVISISSKAINKYHRIIVEDNGIGLNMEYRDRIFQIFQRLHTRDKYPGTGIGLAICKKIVERHGGQIWVESEVGVGTKFIFTLLR